MTFLSSLYSHGFLLQTITLVVCQSNWSLLLFKPLHADSSQQHSLISWPSYFTSMFVNPADSNKSVLDLSFQNLHFPRHHEIQNVFRPFQNLQNRISFSYSSRFIKKKRVQNTEKPSADSPSKGLTADLVPRNSSALPCFDRTHGGFESPPPEHHHHRAVVTSASWKIMVKVRLDH